MFIAACIGKLTKFITALGTVMYVCAGGPRRISEPNILLPANSSKIALTNLIGSSWPNLLIKKTLFLLKNILLKRLGTILFWSTNKRLENTFVDLIVMFEALLASPATGRKLVSVIGLTLNTKLV